MKNIALKVFFLFSAILLSGCPNDEGPYYMFTKIDRDGSCYREFIRSADSAFVAGDTSNNPFPMKIDSTWNLTFYKRTAGDSSRFAKLPAGKIQKENGKEFTWFAVAKKHFPSVEDMSLNFRFDDSDWDSMKSTIDFTRKFRWFYTYYEFSDTYSAINPFKKVPVSLYLSDKEVAALYGEDKELYTGKNGFEIKSMLEEMDKRAEQWLNHSFYEEVFSLYIKHYDRFKDAPVDVDAFASEKDSIFKYYTDSINLITDDLGKLLNHHFQTNAYEVDDSAFDAELEKEFPNFIWYSSMELNYMMTLPGKVIETNAPFLRNDTLSWKVEDDRFFFNDYKLKAISRKPNYWAFAVTGFVILLAIAGLVVRRKPV